MDWEKRFSDIGAFWFHDGNPKRPYARLTSGRISNGFFNGGIVCEHAKLYGKACEELAAHFLVAPHTCVIGPAMGAIALSYRIAEALDCRFAYAEWEDEKKKDRLIFKRFGLKPNMTFVVVEDTITTGGTVERLVSAAREASPGCTILPHLLALCNQSGLAKCADIEVTALIDRKLLTWDEGNNPFTPGGKELVPPLRPKANWHDLTRAYD